MKKTLCLVIFLLSLVIGFSQNRFYAIDVVQAKIDSNNYMSAISYIESLEKIDIDTAWSLFPQKAYCYYKVGLHKEAKSCLGVVEEEGVESNLSEILTSYYMTEQVEQKEDAMERIISLFENGEKEFFNTIAILNKKDLGKLAKFVEDYIVGLEDEDDKTIYNMIAAYFYFQAKENTNAYNKLVNFIDKEPTALSSFLMGIIKSEQNEYLSSISYFYQAEDLGEKSAELYARRGKAKGFEKDYFGAIEDFNIALRKDIKAEYYFLRGVCFNYVLQYEDALFDLNTAIEMCDTVAEYYNQRGIVYSNMEKYPDALIDFQTAIKMNPNAEFIHNNIGLAYEKNGFRDKAMELYKISIRKHPYQSDSYYNLGRLYFENRKYKTAIKYLKEAYLLNPNFGDITHVLGLCYVQIEEIETACNYFQIAIDAGSKNALNSQKEYCPDAVNQE
jgi:tetratricopeptide (TPR) repeat protein